MSRSRSLWATGIITAKDTVAEGTGDIRGIIVEITRRAIMCGNVSVPFTTRTGAGQPGRIALNLAAIAGIVIGTNELTTF